MLCDDEKLAKRICACADDTDEHALMPRCFQNAILAVTATPTALNQAVERARRLLATEAIEREHRTGDANRLVREQLAKLKPEFIKQFRLQACRAFDRVVFAGSQVLTLDERFQVPEEQMLQRAHGQASLRRFLNEKGLIYQPGDALDLNRFLKDVLPGATPVAGKTWVYTAKAVYERFLAAGGLRLVPDGSIVRQTLLKAVEEGKLVLYLGDGRAFGERGVIEGPPSQRRRRAGSPTSFALDDSVEVALPQSDAAKEWTKEDEIREPGVKEPVRQPPPSKATATTWEHVCELAKTRALLELKLRAAMPATAQGFAALAQPLGAESLSLTVSVSGDFKDGGMANLLVGNVRINHPTKPLTVAQTLFNALDESGTFEAELALSFGVQGRNGLADALASLAETAGDSVAPWAQFDKPA